MEGYLQGMHNEVLRNNLIKVAKENKGNFATFVAVFATLSKTVVHAYCILIFFLIRGAHMCFLTEPYGPS